MKLCFTIFSVLTCFSEPPPIAKIARIFTNRGRHPRNESDPFHSGAVNCDVFEQMLNRSRIDQSRLRTTIDGMLIEVYENLLSLKLKILRI